MPMLRAFELSPRPAIPVLVNPVWIVLDCDCHGLPIYGENQLAPIFSSCEAADICVALDNLKDEALEPEDIASIEQFVSQGGRGLAEYLEWSAPE